VQLPADQTSLGAPGPQTALDDDAWPPESDHVEPHQHTKVHAGPQFYRRRLRHFGPLLALLPPVVLIAASAFAKSNLQCAASNAACTQRFVSAWLLPALALPTAVPLGIPIESGPVRGGAAGHSLGRRNVARLVA
jgi:hypothetical protein